jgi:hypothetical protein
VRWIGELGRGRASNLTYFTNCALNATICVIELAGDPSRRFNGSSGMTTLARLRFT